MKSEYAANLTMQTGYKGKYNSPEVAKTQGKYATLTQTLQSWVTKFGAVFTVAILAKQFI